MCPSSVLALEHRPSPTTDQVEDQHYHRNNKQKVDQSTTDTAEHPQQPQDQHNNQNCPKHDSPRSQRAHQSFVFSARRLIQARFTHVSMLRQIGMAFCAVLDNTENNSLAQKEHKSNIV